MIHKVVEKEKRIESKRIKSKKTNPSTLSFTTMYTLPPHKKIPSSQITVDHFTSVVTDSSHNYLSHFHCDHYIGLSRKYIGNIVCSETTSNLIKSKFKLEALSLRMNQWHKMSDHFVYLVDAKHCPGSVCFIFFVNFQFYLHCGDFRATKSFFCRVSFSGYFIENDFFKFESEILSQMKRMFVTDRQSVSNERLSVSNERLSLSNERQSLSNDNCQSLDKLIYKMIFLDNTFQGEKDFPSQKEIIWKIIQEIKARKATLFPVKTKYLFVSYSVGKEKVFFSVAEHFDWAVHIRKYKKEIFSCFTQETWSLLEEEVKEILGKNEVSLKERLTDCESAPLYVIGLCDVNEKRISKLISGCEKVVVFFPTGWNRKNSSFRCGRMSVDVLYFGYSEHSSDKEIDLFKKRMIGEIINTVKRNK